VQSDLIYDLGVNNGKDSEYYLLKGFRVIGVEANPDLYRKVKEELATYIRMQQYILLNCGIWTEERQLKFYVNLDNDHWSSFDPHYGCRDGTRFKTVEIDCVTTGQLLSRYGVPYYMKIDVEGADKHILSALATSSDRPQCISVEEYGVASIDDLHELGYTRFKLVPQSDKSGVRPPRPAREGKFVTRFFDGTDSGLFGKELPGEWMSYQDARDRYLLEIRDLEGRWLAPVGEWYDVHAMR
jgi:FkbM family methyltransferase